MLQRILHWISVGNLWMVSLDVAENPPLEEVLVNLWMVSLEVDHLRIVCGQISRIIQSVTGKVPWKHSQMANKYSCQLPPPDVRINPSKVSPTMSTYDIQKVDNFPLSWRG